MTDIVNAEIEVQENIPLTVVKVIESLSKFPPDSQFVAGIEGVGLTIPIVGAIVVDSSEGVKLTVIQLHGEGVIKAIQHAQQMMPVDGEVGN